MNSHHVLLRQIVAEVRPEMDKEEEVLDVDKSMEIVNTYGGGIDQN